MPTACVYCATGREAELLAERHGLAPVDKEYFYTELRHKQWLEECGSCNVSLISLAL